MLLIRTTWYVRTPRFGTCVPVTQHHVWLFSVLWSCRHHIQLDGRVVGQDRSHDILLVRSVSSPAPGESIHGNMHGEHTTDEHHVQSIRFLRSPKAIFMSYGSTKQAKKLMSAVDERFPAADNLHSKFNSVTFFTWTSVILHTLIFQAISSLFSFLLFFFFPAVSYVSNMGRKTCIL